MASALKILVFVGSCRDNRLGERVVTFIKRKLEGTKHEVTIFDPKEMDFDLVRQPLYFYGDQTKAPEWLQKAGKVVANADVFLIVSPEYNASIPPALSSMLDHFPPKSYAYKPTGICTYSPSIYGGIRCGVALRSLLSELGSISIPSAFTISNATKQLDENGVPLEERMDSKADSFIQKIEWFGEALKKQREATPPPS